MDNTPINKTDEFIALFCANFELDKSIFKLKISEYKQPYESAILERNVPEFKNKYFKEAKIKNTPVHNSIAFFFVSENSAQIMLKLSGIFKEISINSRNIQENKSKEVLPILYVQLDFKNSSFIELKHG